MPKYAIGETVIIRDFYRCTVTSFTFSPLHNQWTYRVKHGMCQWMRVFDWRESELMNEAERRQWLDAETKRVNAAIARKLESRRKVNHEA